MGLVDYAGRSACFLDVPVIQEAILEKLLVVDDVGHPLEVLDHLRVNGSEINVQHHHEALDYHYVNHVDLQYLHLGQIVLPNVLVFHFVNDLLDTRDLQPLGFKHPVELEFKEIDVGVRDGFDNLFLDFDFLLGLLGQDTPRLYKDLEIDVFGPDVFSPLEGTSLNEGDTLVEVGQNVFDELFDDIHLVSKTSSCYPRWQWVTGQRDLARGGYKYG